MSKSVLEAIGAVVAVTGAPWLKQGETKEIGIANLTARILCSRHNSALAPLDNEAGKFFRRVRAIHADLAQKSLSRKRSVYLISGETLELWMLKAACGFFYSRNASSGGVRLIDSYALNDDFAHLAFGGIWATGCGLYIPANIGSVITAENAVRAAPLTVVEEKRVVGCRLIVAGIEFDLIFDPLGANMEDLSQGGWVHRPSELLFSNGDRTHSIALTWLPGTATKSVRTIQRRKRP
jgi:hypothetical protein